jgi:hypothetical protein
MVVGIFTAVDAMEALVDAYQHPAERRVARD